jgi:hypothetical protein
MCQMKADPKKHFGVIAAKLAKVKLVKATMCSRDQRVDGQDAGKAGQVQNWGLERGLLRDEDRTLLRVLGQGLERVLLRGEGRTLLRVLGQGLERLLSRDEGRVLLRALGQGPLRGLGLPELSRGWSTRADEVRCQKPDVRSKKCGTIGKSRTWDQRWTMYE